MSDEGNRQHAIRKAWHRWFTVMIPLMTVVAIATVSGAFITVFAGLIALLACGLMYQRLVNNAHGARSSGASTPARTDRLGPVLSFRSWVTKRAHAGMEAYERTFRP